MYFRLIAVFLIVLASLIGVNLIPPKEGVNLKLESLKQRHSEKHQPSVDHAKLPPLQRTFQSPQEVTAACIGCHTERPGEIMNSSHWNWERVSYIEGRGLAAIGKRNLLNNFCIGSNSNEQACAKCHIGFGMSGDAFDFNNAVNVDCMVCHDNSEKYWKGAALAGYPDRNVNLTEVAQSVGQPRKSNCGACHFYSGGGNNVKHGDLEEALLDCRRKVDVHMASNGLDMSCTACHEAKNHVMKGQLYSVSSGNVNRATCEQCHTGVPHFDGLLNSHTARVSCQACHIPYYAKVNSTKMSWKWSQAGRLKNGEPYHEEDSEGNHTYLSIKGSFQWAKNVTPDYVWFNGTADHYILGDTIQSVPVQMNSLFGGHDDPASKIIPVKIHRGDQIVDKRFNRLIQPKLYSSNEGDSAFWKDFNWGQAAKAGMQRVGLPFSGEYDFIETEMYWPLNHMVSPKEKSVGCSECHIRKGGRLAGLEGGYLPGRDRNAAIDWFGAAIVVLSLLAVLAHASARLAFSFKRLGGRRRGARR